jgi:hypothetical protein
LTLVWAMYSAAMAAEPFEADAPSELQGSDAEELVLAGRRYLAAGRLGHAVDILSYALHVDATPEIHLLMARTLSAIRVHHPKDACAWGAFVDTIMSHVQAAVDGGAVQSDGLAELLDVRAALSGRLAFRLLLDRKALRGKRGGLTLSAVQWHHADGRLLALRADGDSATVRLSSDADRTPHRVFQSGTWSLKKGVVTLSLKGVAASALSLTAQGLGPWTDREPDCPSSFDVWTGE